MSAVNDDIVLRYLERLRGMTDSPHLLAYIYEVEADRREELARRRGEKLIRQMRADGSLKAKSPRKVVTLPGDVSCAHCGAAIKTPHDHIRNQARDERGNILCHPNDEGPDCYRLVTVYHQPVGWLIGRRDQWRGVHRMQSLDDVVAELGIVEDTPRSLPQAVLHGVRRGLRIGLLGRRP